MNQHFGSSYCSSSQQRQDEQYLFSILGLSNAFRRSTAISYSKWTFLNTTVNPSALLLLETTIFKTKTNSLTWINVKVCTL